MQVFYGTQISKQSIEELIKQSEYIIKMKQICKQFLPSKCSQEANGILIQSMNNIIRQNNLPTDIETNINRVMSVNKDNRTPLRIKFIKNQKQSLNTDTKISISKSFGKSSAIKSKRDQCTASTNNRKNISVLNQTYDQSFIEQMDNNSKQNQKRYARTAQVSSRKKYLELKQDIIIKNKDEDDEKRAMLKERREVQRIEKEKKNQENIRISYHRKNLQLQFESTKKGQKGIFQEKKSKVNEIISYQIQNGNILTNRLRKPYRKTIQNLIKLEYQDKTRDRIYRRKSNKQYQVQKKQKAKGQNQQKQKNIALNKQYNNAGSRQISLIPYLTITPGVCLSQRNIQASISRARPSEQLNRQSFIKTLEDKNFRAFLAPRSEVFNLKSMYNTIDVCQKNRASKSTLNNETKDSYRRSVLWGPKTSRQGNRIKILKQDFIKELVGQF